MIDKDLVKVWFVNVASIGMNFISASIQVLTFISLLLGIVYTIIKIRHQMKMKK